MRSWLALAACVLSAACFDAVEPIGPGEPAPRLEYLTVEAAFGTTGRTLVGWSHPQGPNALTGQDASMRFTVRTPTGGTSVVTVTESFDSRFPTPDVVELEYRHGRDVMEIRATHEDAAGRSVTYHCFSPDWACIRQ